MDPRERLLDYYTADVALLAVGTLASFGLWVYGCCLKRSTHDLGRFMTFTRAGLGLATIALLFEMVCYAIILAAYHGSDADIEVTALEQLLNFVSILLHLVYAAIFLGIVALTQRILRARKGIAPAWPLRAAYVWVGILTALAIARYGIAVYRTDAYDRMFWQMEYDDLDWEAIEAGLTLQSAIAIMWFATGLVSFAASAFVVARHRISTVSSAALLSAATAFLSATTYLFAMAIIAEAYLYVTLATLVISIVFVELACVAALGFLVLAGAKGGITATHNKSIHADAPMASV